MSRAPTNPLLGQKRFYAIGETFPAIGESSGPFTVGSLVDEGRGREAFPGARRGEHDVDRDEAELDEWAGRTDDDGVCWGRCEP